MRNYDPCISCSAHFLDPTVRAEPPHPGRVHRFVLDRPETGAGRTASSHGFGLDNAIGLAMVLDRMPRRLIVHAIEAADLTQGPGLSPPPWASWPARSSMTSVPAAPEDAQAEVPWPQGPSPLAAIPTVAVRTRVRKGECHDSHDA